MTLCRCGTVASTWDSTESFRGHTVLLSWTWRSLFSDMTRWTVLIPCHPETTVLEFTTIQDLAWLVCMSLSSTWQSWSSKEESGRTKKAQAIWVGKHFSSEHVIPINMNTIIGITQIQARYCDHAGIRRFVTPFTSAFTYRSLTTRCTTSSRFSSFRPSRSFANASLFFQSAATTPQMATTSSRAS